MNETTNEADRLEADGNPMGKLLRWQRQATTFPFHASGFYSAVGHRGDGYGNGINYGSHGDGNGTGDGSFGKGCGWYGEESGCGSIRMYRATISDAPLL